jgi:hypothetical protein
MQIRNSSGFAPQPGQTLKMIPLLKMKYSFQMLNNQIKKPFSKYF